MTRNIKASGAIKHALLFGIGNYPEENGWPKLSSLKDLVYIETTLLNQGFQKGYIRIVTDGAVTINGISEAFVQLIKEVNPGDIVLIHFSCHGEQVKADNNNKIDGLDECVVSYYAISPYKSTDFVKDQAQYFRGYKLGDYIRQLRTKLGNSGDVIVLLDFCHSGSGTRGIAKVRGGQPPLVPKGYEINEHHKASDSTLLFRESFIEKGDEYKLASYEVFSATRPEELDMETENEKGEGVGSLTYAVCKSFEHLNPGTTYRSFFANIQSIMNTKVPSQHPLLEGNGMDRLMFGGAFVVQKRYIEIVKILHDKKIVVKAGLLAGLDSGSKLALYPSGTNDPSGSASLASGIVIQTESYFATVQLDKDPGIGNPAQGWLFVTQAVYNMKPIPVEILSNKNGDPNLNFSPSEEKNIKAGLRDLSLITFSGKPELLIAKGRMEDSIKIAASGYLFSTIKSASAGSNELEEKIQQYAQYKFLQQLDLSDKNAMFDVELVPVVNGLPDISKIKDKIVNGIYEFTNHDTLVIWVKNTGNRAAYINILDMQPDGLINPLLPNKVQKIYSYDLKINPGENHLFSEYRIVVAPPYGTELLKIFASTSEIDVEGIADTRGVGAKGNLSVLEKLIINSYTLSTRGATLINLENANGSAYNLLFRIKP